MNKPELIAMVKQYIFLKKQVCKTYVDMNPNPNGRLYTTIEISSTRTIGAILTELNQKLYWSIKLILFSTKEYIR